MGNVALRLAPSGRRTPARGPAWRSCYATASIPKESYHGLYEDTSTFRPYSADVIPGFLQTHAYASALPCSITRFCDTPDDTPQAADAPVARFRIVHRAGHRFVLVIEEAVLRHRIADTPTTAEQPRYLPTAMTFPQVCLGENTETTTITRGPKTSPPSWLAFDGEITGTGRRRSAVAPGPTVPTARAQRVASCGCGVIWVIIDRDCPKGRAPATGVGP
ncbi:Scr1 family TA system antitoxin-like transcriptional regulator [Embleya sp. NPDC059237]|uniref:Scr1 family TA system antitoxin-like transcriptional regulator n=1 Tax=Embleya sp. NPDC059237 TaxID=3346784 RepID=UPI0036B9FFA9